MKTKEISNSQDVIDSRDVIRRIEELKDLVEENNDLPDEEFELEILEKLAEESNSSPDWKYGEILIRESYFVEYCQEMIIDIGDLPEKIPEYLVIDWDATAENLKADYMSVDFGGIEYLIRA